MNTTTTPTGDEGYYQNQTGVGTGGGAGGMTGATRGAGMTGAGAVPGDIGAGGPKNYPNWDVTLFGCFRHLVPNCLMVTFCPCVSYGQVTVRTGYFTDYLLSTFMFCVTMPCCYCCHLYNLRHYIRDKYRLQGSPATDALYGICCPCCSLAQMATQTRAYEPGNCSYGAPPRDMGVAMERV